MRMTHEVLANDGLDDPIVSGFIIHVVFASLLGDELGSLLLDQLFVRRIFGVIPLECIIACPSLFPLPNYQSHLRMEVMRETHRILSQARLRTFHIDNIKILIFSQISFSLHRCHDGSDITGISSE